MSRDEVDLGTVTVDHDGRVIAVEVVVTRADGTVERFEALT